MSRSIHDTHRAALAAWRQAKATDSQRDWDKARAVRANVWRQRSVKRRLREQRVRVAPVPVDPDRVAILTIDEDVHHPATSDDLRAVMKCLPPGRLDGLSTIRLAGVEDPTDEFLPDVHASSLRGLYTATDRLVRLCGYHCTGALSPHVALFLKLRTLATFVHELAHHYDFMFRTRGDRWRMDDRRKTEAFARATAFEHVAAHVLPCLEQRYPEEYRALGAWIEEHAGIALPLQLLADDRTEQASIVEYGFCELVRRSENARDTFAIGLHIAHLDHLASAMLDRNLVSSAVSEKLRRDIAARAST